MLADKVHQELYSKQRNYKSNQRTNQKQSPLESGDGSKAGFQDEFQNLVAACTEHDRNCHEEGKFGCNQTGTGEQHCT